MQTGVAREERMTQRRSMIPTLLLAALAPLGACTESALLELPDEEVALDIRPQQATMTAIGETITLEPIITTEGGDRYDLPAGQRVKWISLAPQVVSVDASGVVEARQNGQATIVGSVFGLVDSVFVTVSQVPKRVVASPAADTLAELNATTRLSAEVFDANDIRIPDADVSWRSTNPSVAEVDGTGKVIAVGEGKAGIIATVDKVADTVSIVVSPTPAPPTPTRVTVAVSPSSSNLRVGQTLQLKATATDDNGSALDDVEIRWSSLNPEIASVTSAGRVTARAAGTALVIATAVCCGSADTATVIVEPGGSNVEPFFADNFDNGRRNDANGFTWSGGRNAPVSDDIAHSGSYSLKFAYGPVEPDGSSHWWTEQRFSLGRQLKEVWIEYYIYYPNGKEGLGSAAMAHRDGPSSDNNKFFRLWGGGHSAYGGNSSKVGMSTRPRNGKGPEGVIFFEYTRAGSSGTGPFDGPGSYPWEDDLGRWIQVRMYYKHVSRPGANDGVMRLWKDGKLWIDFQGVNQEYNRDHPYWDSGYFMGYDNSGFDNTTFIYIDDVKFYDRDPGWE